MDAAADPPPIPEVAPPPAPAVPAAAPPRRYSLEFTGTASEYFRIWSVNLALTIATLGIYSAWAKVRKKRYFYAHTHLDGDPFEYRGNPVAILKGRLVAVAVLALLYASTRFAPELLWVVVPAAIFVFPWLVIRSYAFNARNSAWRNVHLRFGGAYWKCWRIFVGYGLLTIVTVGLGYAWLKTRLTEFVVGNHAFGATPFASGSLKPPFLRAYGRMIAMGFVMGLTLTTVMSGLMLQFGWVPRQNSPGVMAMNVVWYAFYLWLFAYIRARVLNATWNHATLGTMTFESTLRARELFRLYVVNIFAIVVTLGLATPWAVVRTLRYRAQHFTAIAPDGLEGFAAAHAREVGAAGEEVGEMLDIDFSL